MSSITFVVPGQKVSNAQSHVFFSPNVKPELVENLCGSLSIQATSFSEIPWISTYKKKRKTKKEKTLVFLLGILEQIEINYIFWLIEFFPNQQVGKPNSFPFAGRSVLAQSVMAAISTFVMQGIALLVSLCNKLHRIKQELTLGILR